MTNAVENNCFTLQFPNGSRLSVEMFPGYRKPKLTIRYPDNNVTYIVGIVQDAERLMNFFEEGLNK